MLTLANFEQFAKPYSPIVVTLSGILIEVNEEQSLKALSPIEVN